MESPILQTNHPQREDDRENIVVDSSLKINSNHLGETTSFTTTSVLYLTEVTDIEKDDPEDLVILRRDPTTRRNLINKSAYAKLHRTLSPGRNSTTIDSLKEKYETNKPDLIDVRSQAKEDPEVEQKKQTPPVNLDEETLQSLKNKYSPSSFGYPKTDAINSKLPVARARSNSKSQIILPLSKQPEKKKLRQSLNVDRKPSSRDENSNELYRKNSSSSGEFITIITRPKSEESIDQFEKELNLFTMDEKPKEKKRSNSFRKIFSGRIFGKDKKKKEEKNKVPYKENVAQSDNIQNESAFNRQAAYRHTTGGNSNVRTKEANVSRSGSDRAREKPIYITKEMENQYAQMHVHQFNHIKEAFEHPIPGVSPTETIPPVQPTGYVRMDKPLVKNSPGPLNYVHMPNVNKFIDTSSSPSTPDSDQSNIYQNEPFTKANRDEPESNNENTVRSIRFNENRDGPRDTPPRAQELRQDVTLVNPKALIPINSERPLPNPYQNSNSSTLDKPKVPVKPSINNAQREQKQPQPRLDETYGTVFDSLENGTGRSRPMQRLSSNSSLPKGLQKPPKSPSLEPSKLKLPPNREIVPLSPRVQSPIPHDNISTDKIIATELLKSAKSPTAQRRSTSKLASPSHQKLEIDIDYPDNINNERNEKLLDRNINAFSKPPISKIPLRRSSEAPSASVNSLSRQRISQTSPAIESKRLSQSSPASENMENIYARYRKSQASPVVENQERITTNAMVHVNSPNPRTPTPNQVLYNRSLSPVTPQSARSSTPVELRSTSAQSSPQKEDMRKSVEAYYWKELKKLKEQENLDLYVYQMQMMPYGYAEDPVTVRKSRSMSPTAQRNSRRSLSLPRDPRPANVVKDSPENLYGRMQHASIPEDRVLMNQRIPQRKVILYEQQYPPQFRRSAPERRTVDGSPRRYENYNNSLYRPIFKRGSLTTPVKGPMEDPQNKRVSFSSTRADTQSLQSWPTRNGFTQSPPQRRMESNRNNNLEDDVFLPNSSRGYDDSGVYGYANKPQDLRPEYTNEDIYYNSRHNMLLKKEPVYDPDPQVQYRQINMQEYVQTPEESLYGQPIDAVKPSPYGLTRHGSIQIREPLYEQRVVARRMSYDNVPLQRRMQEPHYVNRQNQIDPRYGMKREIIVKDEIFGQFGGYIPQNEERYLINRQLQNPLYSSRQSVESVSPKIGPRQIYVRNKVCDIYGQIHDRDSPSVNSPSHIRKTGVILGQLQSNPGSPQVVRHMPNEQFVRNTRLTASANDMYRRYQSAYPRYRSDVVYDRYPQSELEAPTRPLPPVPMVKKPLLRNNSGSASDAEVVNSSAKNKKRSFFGK